jgi:sulfate permease, SulP family
MVGEVPGPAQAAREANLVRQLQQRRLGRWLRRVVPGIGWIRTYSRANFLPDLLAGITVAAVILPIAMAYGQLAGLPPISGVYASLLALIAYALFGSSRHLVLGPDTTTAALVAVTVAPLANGNMARYAALAAALALLVGALCLIGGFARFGFVANFLSRPILIGYMNGLALLVIASQLGEALGLPVTSHSFFGQLAEVVKQLPELNWASLAISVAVVAMILLLKRYAPRVPGVLIAMGTATLVVALFDLTAHGVATIGPIPSGLPSLQIPVVSFGDLRSLLPAAAGIVLLIFCDTIVTARTFAVRNGYDVDANREFIGLGMSNLAAGVSQGFPISASATRTAANEAAGGQTQATSVVASVVLALMLLFLVRLLSAFPTAALGAILIAAALTLFDISTLYYLYRVRKQDFIIALLTLVGVVTTGLLEGIVFAILVSFLLLLARAVRPHDAVLGQVKGLDGFHDIGDYPESETLSGLIVYRFDAPLFFANAEYFARRVRRLIAEAQSPVEWFIVDAEAITDLDSTAAGIVESVRAELAAGGTVLAVARAKHALQLQFDRMGLTERIGTHHFFPSIRTAVTAFLTRKRQNP